MDNFFDKFRERFPLIRFILGKVGDDAAVKVNGDFVAVVNIVAGFFAFQNGKTDIDGIAVKNPGKGFGDDTGDSRFLDSDGGVFPGGTAAEIKPCHHNIAVLTNSASMSSMQWLANSL